MSSAPSTKGCPQEARVLRAVKTGRWDDALKAHAAGCPACGEVALVSGRLLRSALETECSALGFLDSGLTVFAPTLPRPARRGHVAPGPGCDSRISPASTARCTSA